MVFLSVKTKSFLKGTKPGKCFIRFVLNQRILNRRKIDKTISRYMNDLSSNERKEIKKDILNMAKKYRFSANEYFCYHFKDKTEEERKTFISDWNRIDFCEKLNQAKNLAIFNDKCKCAEIFEKYYGREICGIKGMRDLKLLETFAQKHKRFIIKPLAGTCGQGIRIVEQEWDRESLKKLIRKYCVGISDGFIVEEVIVQVPEMAQFHPSSLNTIRLSTVRFDEGAEVIAAFFRTGRGGNIVDNAGAGGVFGTIDVSTGRIDAVGDEYGNNYDVHPDSKLKMLDFVIPKWQEAVDMAKELAQVIPDNRYCGWDLALTEKGWVMIEGNARGQFVWQMPRQKGFLEESNKILRRLKMEEITKLHI